jgi:hypothetical protein
MNQSTCASKIQNWWKKNTCILRLRRILTYLENALSSDDLQELSDFCNSITIKCKGDGCGLLGGSLIDMLLCELFQSKLSLYEEFHEGESDMKLCDVPLSQKKINGKSTIALDWSKNQTQTTRSHFTSDILLINLKTELWWKKSPYNREVKSGIYLIDKQYCKKYVDLASNNKTNTLINSHYLYKMINRSIQQNLFITIPPPKNILHFNILNAFIH